MIMTMMLRIKNICRQYWIHPILQPPIHQGIVEFLGLPPLIPLLQYVNRLGFEICSVDSCQTEQGSLVTLI